MGVRTWRDREGGKAERRMRPRKDGRSGVFLYGLGQGHATRWLPRGKLSRTPRARLAAWPGACGVRGWAGCRAAGVSGSGSDSGTG